MSSRFEIILPKGRREELDELARSLDTTPSELARLGLVWVLNNRDLLLRGGEPPAQVRGAAA